MTAYKNNDGASGVESYDIRASSIAVKFKDTVRVYEYSYRSAGMENIEHMKKLAAQGQGLNAFINNNVKFKYVK